MAMRSILSRFAFRVRLRALEARIGNALLLSSMRGDADPGHVALAEFAFELRKAAEDSFPTGAQFPAWLRRRRP